MCNEKVDFLISNVFVHKFTIEKVVYIHIYKQATKAEDLELAAELLLTLTAHSPG